MMMIERTFLHGFHLLEVLLTVQHTIGLGQARKLGVVSLREWLESAGVQPVSQLGHVTGAEA